MLLLWLLIGFVVLWAGIVLLAALSTELCPRCGLKLDREFGAPWKVQDRCGCGWSRH